MDKKLKEKIHNDIIFLKTFEPEIISANIFYGKMLTSALKMFAFVLITHTIMVFVYMLLGFLDHFEYHDLHSAVHVGLRDGLIGGFIIGGGMFIFCFLPLANKYTLFKETYFHHLQSGQALDELFKGFSYLIWAIYLTLSFFIGIPGGGPGVGYVISFIVTLVLTGMIINFEFTRVAIPQLPTLISQLMGSKK